MTVSNIRNHPYAFEQALQSSTDYTPPPPITRQQQQQQQSTAYFTWLVFMHAKWVPFDAENQSKLEQTLNLGGTFVDIQDTHFPGVKRVRVFPKSNYLSYLGVKYRLSRVMQPDAWKELRSIDENNSSSEEHLPYSSSPDDNIDRINEAFFPPPSSFSNTLERSDNTTNKSVRSAAMGRYYSSPASSRPVPSRVS